MWRIGVQFVFVFFSLASLLFLFVVVIALLFVYFVFNLRQFCPKLCVLNMNGREKTLHLGKKVVQRAQMFIEYLTFTVLANMSFVRVEPQGLTFNYIFIFWIFFFKNGITS